MKYILDNFTINKYLYFLVSFSYTKQLFIFLWKCTVDCFVGCHYLPIVGTLKQQPSNGDFPLLKSPTSRSEAWKTGIIYYQTQDDIIVCMTLLTWYYISTANKWKLMEYFLFSCKYFSLCTIFAVSVSANKKIKLI